MQGGKLFFHQEIKQYLKPFRVEIEPTGDRSQTGSPIDGFDQCFGLQPGKTLIVLAQFIDCLDYTIWAHQQDGKRIVGEWGIIFFPGMNGAFPGGIGEQTRFGSELVRTYVSIGLESRGYAISEGSHHRSIASGNVTGREDAGQVRLHQWIDHYETPVVNLGSNSGGKAAWV